MEKDPGDILSVSDFTREVKNLLEQNLPPCWVRGEISNLRHQSSGHVYFTLKDEGSQVSCVVFRGVASRLSMTLKEGQQILIFGEISVYEPRGSYQLIGRVVLEEGKGNLQREFEKLKQKLGQEGLFDPTKKKPIPPLPKHIAFITSPTGAAIQDFISILKRRGWRGRLTVLPAQVQGNTAAPEMIEQLKRAQTIKTLDLLIIGRGGGSLEDLWAFNDESLVRQIAQCPIPIISAVGHEIDFTLTDFVADLRAETPSAAAEYIVRNYSDLINRFDLLLSRMAGLSPRVRLENIALILDDLRTRLNRNAQDILRSKKEQFEALQVRLRELFPENKVILLRERFTQISKRLECASMQSVLDRGFVIVKDHKGNFVRSTKKLSQGQKLTNVFSDGSIEVEVASVN